MVSLQPLSKWWACVVVEILQYFCYYYYNSRVEEHYKGLFLIWFRSNRRIKQDVIINPTTTNQDFYFFVSCTMSCICELQFSDFTRSTFLAYLPRFHWIASEMNTLQMDSGFDSTRPHYVWNESDYVLRDPLWTHYCAAYLGSVVVSALMLLLQEEMMKAATDRT